MSASALVTWALAHGMPTAPGGEDLKGVMWGAAEPMLITIDIEPRTL